MWGIYSFVNIVHKRPCWYYRIGGSEDFVSSIKTQEGIVIYKKAAYYKLKKFYGPVITFNKRCVDGNEKYIPYRPNGIPEAESQQINTHQSVFASAINNKSYYRRLQEKFLPTSTYDRDRSIKLKDVVFTDWDTILILANAFVNYTSISYFIRVVVRGNAVTIDIQLSEIISWILGKKSGINSLYTFEFISFLENKYQFFSSFYINRHLSNSLYPFNRVELYENKYTGWTTCPHENSQQDWSIEVIKLPVCLLKYIEREFKVYAVAQAISYDEWLQEQMEDEDDEYDYRDMIQDGLDDMHQADPDWYWNVD